AYQIRLQDTQPMIALLKETYKYFDMLQDKKTMAEIDTTRLSLIYTQYQRKFDALSKQVQEEEKMLLVAKPTKTLFKFGGEDILQLPNTDVTKYARFVFENGDTRLQTEAMLYLIFNMALHNRFELCRDLLLMSHLGSQSRIGTANVDLQILYNRALVQFALSAFIQGKWHPCMLILQEFYQSSKIRILLAQAIPPTRDREVLTSEQIKQEALAMQRLLPPHLYFRPDTLEAVHLISSILLEIPSMVTGSRKAIKNKFFRNRVWDPYLKRDLRVPPEGTQSSILTAGIHLQDGNWQECAALLKSLRLWSDIEHADFVQGKVLNSVKHECMRCYLHRFGTVYESISLSKLAAMFELSEAETKQYVCRMIISNSEDRFRASMDELTNCLIIHQKPATALQRIALEYTNKLAFLIEQNEKSIGIRRFDHLNVGTGANAQRFKRTGYSGPRTDRRGPEGQERQGQPGQERQAGQTQGQGQRGQFLRKSGGQAPQRRPIFMRA
ncbi:translation initiation factor, partial [Reticulomyxa filosa]